MAGIGFHLKKMLDQESYFSTLKAYLYSANVSSGPWIVSILVIGLLGVIQAENVPFQQINVFRATLIYIYAFSLIVVGLLQMPLTRYLADLLFNKDIQMYLPAYCASLIITGVLQGLIAIPAFFLFTDWSVNYALHAVICYLVVSFIWIAMIFVSAVKDFKTISWAFVIGGLVSVAAAHYLGRVWGPEGYLMGYTLGQFIIFLVLTMRLAVEFPTNLAVNFEFLRYFKLFPTLIMIGFLYNMAIWVDKFVFWFGPTGEQVDAFLYSYTIYDAPMFMAYLTIIPSLAIFLMHIETDFFQHYKGYYGAIVNKKSLATILAQKRSMVRSIMQNIRRLLKFQGVISLIAILAVPLVITRLNLSWLSLTVLKIGILAAFLQVLLLFLSILLLYFEFRLEALILNLMFFVLNGGLTWLTLLLGPLYYGYGYLTACFFTLLTGLILFDYKIKNLEYLTFMKQPVR
ncbi:exopolysaccharide Pel transporter PelG [Gemmatimonadota bacterium]